MEIQSSLPQPISLSIEKSGHYVFEEKKLERLFDNAIFAKIKAKPILLEKIRALNAEIDEIEEKINESSRNIAFFQGGEAAKLPFIGCIIKFLFQWINRTFISQENQKFLSHKTRKAEYEQTLTFLRQSLPTGEEDRPSIIFELDYQIRKILETDFPNHQNSLKIYNEKIIPIINQFKKSLIEETYHFVAVAAAEKGKAAQAGLKALKKLIHMQPIIKNSKTSTQQVYLLPQEGVVFKHSGPKRREEEAIANSLFALMSKQATVSSFSICKTSAQNFGIELSSDERARCLSPENLSPTLLEEIKKKLSKETCLILNNYRPSSPKDNPLLKNYQRISKQEWYVQIPEKSDQEKPEKKTFKELLKLHLSTELSPEIRIGDSPEMAMSLQDHIFSNKGRGTPLAQALAYLPTLNRSPQKILLSPDLSDPEARDAYEFCEKLKWTYIDENNNPHHVDFKTLHCLFFEKKTMEQISTTPHHPSAALNEKINKALNVGWKVISDELMKNTSGSISKLSNIVVKPFIDEMILMSQLDQEMIENILNRLTPDAEFNSILTGEIQLLDMHANNLGVTPEPNSDYEQFKNTLFTLPIGCKKFKDLILLYLHGKISSTTLVQFEDRGVVIQKTLSELPSLQKALNSQWQLVIFDTDLSLAEDNRLQLQVYRGVPQHLIPLRSALLETKWKDKPLSKETVKRLLESKERDFLVMQWAQRLDAPIYKRLSPLTIEHIRTYLNPYIENYSLSIQQKENKNINGNPFKKNEVITIKSLKSQFVQEICDPVPHNVLWKMIEEDLSYFNVRSGVTWESLAHQYRQNIEDLQKLNQNILIPEKRIRIQYDLTSDSSFAVEKRKRIANQLFPRITYRQLKALKERLNSRKEYLSSYLALLANSLNGKELKNFIMKKTTPLSSTRKREYLLELDYPNSLTTSEDQFFLIKESLRRECEPTYFNLMKAMYPLLANANALTLAIHQNTRKAGQGIGLYKESLESTIFSAIDQGRFDKDSSSYKLARYLKKQIKSIKDPSFFGYWI